MVVEAVAPTPKKRSAREKTTMSEHRVAEATAPSAAPTVEEKPTAPRSVGELRAALQTYTEKHGMALGIDLLKDFGCSRITEMAALDPKLQEEFVGLANG